MELREILEDYNPQWFEEMGEQGILREKYLEMLREKLRKKDITFLIGLRRIGKTTLLKQFIHMLQTEMGVDGRRILYLSLDHPVLQNYELGEIIREFRKMNEISKKEKIYLFLYEILYMKNVFQWLKVINDNERVKVYATSSSALRLKDKKGFVTGRHSTIRIKPLSFREYLTFRGKDKREPHLLERYFEEYLKNGGIPEYVLRGEIEYLVDLAEDIIMKDISARRNLANPMKLRELFLILVSRIGKPITYAKLARLLSVKEETVEQYLSYLVSSELVHVVYRWSKSLNERIYSPKKVYLGDVGFRYALTGEYSLGSNFENVMFLNILEEEPFYYLDKGVEIDFITRSKEVYECKYGREITEEQREALERLRRRGYRVKIIKGYRDFL